MINSYRTTIVFCGNVTAASDLVYVYCTTTLNNIGGDNDSVFHLFLVFVILAVARCICILLDHIASSVTLRVEIQGQDMSLYMILGKSI